MLRVVKLEYLRKFETKYEKGSYFEGEVQKVLVNKKMRKVSQCSAPFLFSILWVLVVMYGLLFQKKIKEKCQFAKGV